jgi:hypothetical protein
MNRAGVGMAVLHGLQSHDGLKSGVVTRDDTPNIPTVIGSIFCAFSLPARLSRDSRVFLDSTHLALTTRIEAQRSLNPSLRRVFLGGPRWHPPTNCASLTFPGSCLPTDRPECRQHTIFTTTPNPAHPPSVSSVQGSSLHFDPIMSGLPDVGDNTEPLFKRPLPKLSKPSGRKTHDVLVPLEGRENEMPPPAFSQSMGPKRKSPRLNQHFGWDEGLVQ